MHWHWPFSSLVASINNFLFWPKISWRSERAKLKMSGIIEIKRTSYVTGILLTPFISDDAQVTCYSWQTTQLTWLLQIYPARQLNSFGLNQIPFISLLDLIPIPFYTKKHCIVKHCGKWNSDNLDKPNGATNIPLCGRMNTN